MPTVGYHATLLYRTHPRRQLFRPAALLFQGPLQSTGLPPPRNPIPVLGGSTQRVVRIRAKSVAHGSPIRFALEREGGTQLGRFFDEHEEHTASHRIEGPRVSDGAGFEETSRLRNDVMTRWAAGLVDHQETTRNVLGRRKAGQ